MHAPPSIVVRAEGETVQVLLDRAGAPHTVDALLACLPARVDLHCAKIAGDQALFFLPVIVPLEGGTAAESVAPGSLTYWSDRQLFGLFFGPGQKERASVTVAGRVAGDLAGLRRVGERLQREHGQAILWATLEAIAAGGAGGGGAGRSGPEGHGGSGVTGSAGRWPGDTAREQPAHPRVEEARRARLAMWQGIPREVTDLVNRRGVMIPAGPLLYAESETRELHENLWGLREAAMREHRTLPASSIPGVAVVLLTHAAERLGGFSGLEESARFLTQAARWLEESPAGYSPDQFLPLLDELMLYTGRLNAWLDLFVPWQRFNDVLLNRERPAAP